MSDQTELQREKSKYYRDRADKIRARARKRYYDKREAILRQQREYYDANRDAIRLADKMGISRAKARALIAELELIKT